MTREKNTYSLKIRSGSSWISRISNVFPSGRECLFGPSWRCVCTSESDSEPDISWSLISNIISSKSESPLPVLTPKLSAEQAGKSTEFSSTSSTSWRGSSNWTLLSMKIYFVLIFSSLNPLYSSGYPINKHSMLYGCKYFLLSDRIWAHAVGPNTLKFDTSSFCKK